MRDKDRTRETSEFKGEPEKKGVPKSLEAERPEREECHGGNNAK